MTNINYETIARAWGYSVTESQVLEGRYYWSNGSDIQCRYSESIASCYKACCVENNLIEG